MSRWIDANEDVISREWILKEFDKGKPMLYQSEYFAELFWLVRHAPAVEPKQGEWIDKGWHGDWQFETDGRGNCWHEYECSECGFHSKGSKSNYCPNCGCRMKGTKIVGKHADQMIIDEACMKGADDETH